MRAGLRRAKLEGRRLGRPPLLVDREAVRRDRQQGLSIGQLAKQHGIAETSMHGSCASPNPPRQKPSFHRRRKSLIMRHGFQPFKVRQKQ